MSVRIASVVWVQAFLRRCDLAAVPVYILRRGDAGAGAIWLKLVRETDEVSILQVSRDDDTFTMHKVLDEAGADHYLARQETYDPDLWIIEVDDRAGRSGGIFPDGVR